MATDLDEEKPAGGGSQILNFKPTVAPTDVLTRKWISYLLLALLASVVVAGFVALFLINNAGPIPAASVVADAVADDDRLMRLLNVVFGPLVTLFSSVVGFYFGAKTANEVPPGAGGEK